jgi:hypothetical protein
MAKLRLILIFYKETEDTTGADEPKILVKRDKLNTDLF